MRSVLVWLTLVAVVLSAPVPTVQETTGRPKILENSMEVKTLSYLLRDCVRCHGLHPTHVYDKGDDYPRRFFDSDNKLKTEYIYQYQKRLIIANGVGTALRSAWMYQPKTEEGKQEIRQAAQWLRSLKP